MTTLKKTYPREQRGLAILAKDQIKVVNDSTYYVQSQSKDGWYLVTNKRVTRQGPKRFKCECPDFVYRRIVCKHIHAVKFLLNMKQELKQEKPTQDLQVTNPKKEENLCPRCKSIRISKAGFRYNDGKKVQRYQCRDCKYRFTLNEGFERMRNDPKIITLSLDLYFKGISLHKISDHINQFYGVKICYTSIYRWIRKYSKIIGNHVDKLTPEVSGIWHTDEMALDVKGGHKWMWNLIDHNTRFLVASHITESREIKDAREVFARAKAIAKKRPHFVVTDGLMAYQDAFNKEFYTMDTRTKHVRLASIHNYVNNNIIERLHGTIRERNKVMRGLGNNGSSEAMMSGYKTYYNFVRPHMRLNGKTPAEVANIPLQLGDNRWLSLIQLSTNPKF
jgi:putative transposase